MEKIKELLAEVKLYQKGTKIYILTIILAFGCGYINYKFYTSFIGIMFRETKFIFPILLINYAVIILIVIAVSYFTIKTSKILTASHSLKQKKYFYLMFATNCILVDLFLCITLLWNLKFSYITNRLLLLVVVITILVNLINRFLIRRAANIAYKKPKFIVKPTLPIAIGAVYVLGTLFYCGYFRDSLVPVDSFKEIENTYPEVSDIFVSDYQYSNNYQQLTIIANADNSANNCSVSHSIELVYKIKNRKWVQTSKNDNRRVDWKIEGKYAFENNTYRIETVVASCNDQYVIGYQINKYSGYAFLNTGENDFTGNIIFGNKNAAIKIDQNRFVIIIDEQEFELSEQK